MTATMPIAERLTIDDQTVREARATSVPRGASLMVRLSDGREVSLPENIQRTLLGALNSIAEQGSVSIGRIPEELTSTAAADMLGVSRPTLMKWVRAGELKSFKVGSHTRFQRDDVLELRAERAAERRAAFEELRALDAEIERDSED